jgi:hypothetical protein
MGFHAFQSFPTLGSCRAGGESGPCCAQPRRCNSTGVSFSAEIAANPNLEVPISPHLLVAIELQPEKVLLSALIERTAFDPVVGLKMFLIIYLHGGSSPRLLPPPIILCPDLPLRPRVGGLLSLSCWFRSIRDCCTHPARQAVKSGALL